MVLIQTLLQTHLLIIVVGDGESIDKRDMLFLRPNNEGWPNYN